MHTASASGCYQLVLHLGAEGTSTSWRAYPTAHIRDPPSSHWPCGLSSHPAGSHLRTIVTPHPCTRILPKPPHVQGPTALDRLGPPPKGAPSPGFPWHGLGVHPCVCCRYHCVHSAKTGLLQSRGSVNTGPSEHGLAGTHPCDLEG